MATVHSVNSVHTYFKDTVQIFDADTYYDDGLLINPFTLTDLKKLRDVDPRAEQFLTPAIAIFMTMYHELLQTPCSIDSGHHLVIDEMYRMFQDASMHRLAKALLAAFGKVMRQIGSHHPVPISDLVKSSVSEDFKQVLIENHQTFIPNKQTTFQRDLSTYLGNIGKRIVAY